MQADLQKVRKSLKEDVSKMETIFSVGVTKDGQILRHAHGEFKIIIPTIAQLYLSEPQFRSIIDGAIQVANKVSNDESTTKQTE